MVASGRSASTTPAASTMASTLRLASERRRRVAVIPPDTPPDATTIGAQYCLAGQNLDMLSEIWNSYSVSKNAGRRVVATSAALAAAFGVWAARRRLADRATERLFRRPSGRLARSFYREARPHQESFRETLEALALGPEDRLLEVGCGGGTFLEWALATGCTAHAIDHSAEMLRLTTARTTTVRRRTPSVLRRTVHGRGDDQRVLLLRRARGDVG